MEQRAAVRAAGEAAVQEAPVRGVPEPEGLPKVAALEVPRPGAPWRNRVEGPARPRMIWVREQAGCQPPQRYLQERTKLAAVRRQLESRAQQEEGELDEWRRETLSRRRQRVEK